MGCVNYNSEFYELVESQRLSTDFKQWVEDFFSEDDAISILIAIETGDWSKTWEVKDLTTPVTNEIDRKLGDNTPLLKKESEKSLLSFYSSRGSGLKQGSTAVRDLRRKFRREIVNRLVYDFEERVGIKANIMTPTGNRGSKLLYQYKLELLRELWAVTGNDYSDEIKDNDITFTNIVSKTIHDYQIKLKTGLDEVTDPRIYDIYVTLVQFDNLLKSEIDFIKIKDSYRKGTILGVDMYDYVGSTMKRDSSLNKETAETFDYTGSIVKLLLDEMFPIISVRQVGDTIEERETGEYLNEESFIRAMTAVTAWIRYGVDVDEDLRTSFFDNFSEFDIEAGIKAYSKYLRKNKETSNYSSIIKNILHTIEKFIFNSESNFSQNIAGSFKRHVKDNFSQTYTEYGPDLATHGILPGETNDYFVKRQQANISKILRSQVNMWRKKPNVWQKIIADNSITLEKNAKLGDGTTANLITFSDGINSVSYKLVSSEKNGIVSWSAELIGSKNALNQLDLNYCITLLRQILGIELPIGYEDYIKDILRLADNSTSANNFIMDLFGEAIVIATIAGSNTFTFKTNSKTNLIDTYLYNKYLTPIAQFFTLAYGQDSMNVVKNQEGNSLPLYTVGSISKKVKDVIHSASSSHATNNPFIRVPRAIKNDSVRGQIKWGDVVKSSKDLRMNELFATIPVLDYFYNLDSIVKLVPITTSDKSTHPLIGVDLSEFKIGDTTAKDILTRIAAGNATSDDLRLIKLELINYRGNHAKKLLTDIVNKYIDVLGLETTRDMTLDQKITLVNKKLNTFKNVSEVRKLFRSNKSYDFNEVLDIDTDFNGKLSLNQELLEEHYVFNTNRAELDNYLDLQRRMFAEDMHTNRFLINLRVFKDPRIDDLVKFLGDEWVDPYSHEMKAFIVKQDGKTIDVSWAQPIPADAKVILNPIFESYFWASTVYGNALGDLLAGHASSYKKGTRFYKDNKNKVISPLNDLAIALNVVDEYGNPYQLVASSSYEEIQKVRSLIEAKIKDELKIQSLDNIKTVVFTRIGNWKAANTLKLDGDNIIFTFDNLLEVQNSVPVYDFLDERAFRAITKSERTKEKTKRALFLGSTVTTPLWGDPGVPPKEVNVACISDLPAFAFNLLGQQHNKESHDGCGFVTTSFARGANKGMYDASIGTAVRKTIAGGLYADTGSFWEIKWAEMAVNNIMRSQTYDESEFSMEIMFKKMHDKRFLIRDKETLNLSMFYGNERHYNRQGDLITYFDPVYFLNPEDGEYYKIVNIEEDPNSRGDVQRTLIKVVKQGDNFVEEGAPIKRQFKINNLYDIDQLFGGCFCKKMDENGQLVDSDANEEILYTVISERNLWDYMISIVVNQSGMKVGQKNVNESIIDNGQNALNNIRKTIFAWDDLSSLDSFKVVMDFYGAIMDADHELQNATVREANQLISALIQDDNNYEIVSRIYHDIGEVAYKSLTPFFEALELHKRGDSSKLFEKIGKAVIDAYNMRDQDDIGLAYAFLDNINETIGEIPFSSGSISSVALSALGSTLTKMAIKTDYPGSGSIQVPSNGFMKFYSYNGKTYNYEGMIKEIMAINRMTGLNINIRDAFRNPGNLHDVNPFVIKLYDDNDPSGRLKIDLEDTIIEENVTTGETTIIKIATPEVRDYYRNRKNDPNVRYYRWELKSRDLLPPQMTFEVNGQTYSVYDLDPVRVHTYIRLLTGKFDLAESDRQFMTQFIKDYAIKQGFVISDSLTKADLKKVSDKATVHLKRLLSIFSDIQQKKISEVENQSAFNLSGFDRVQVQNLNVESGQIIAGKAFMDKFDLADGDTMDEIMKLGKVFFRNRLTNKYNFPKEAVVSKSFYDGVIYTRSGEKILLVKANKDKYGNWNDDRLKDTSDYVGLDFDDSNGSIWFKSSRGDEEICSSEHLMVRSKHTSEGTFTVLVVDDFSVIDDVSSCGVSSHVRFNVTENNYTELIPYIDDEYVIETDDVNTIVKELQNKEFVRNINAIDALAVDRWEAFQKSINYVGTRIPAQSMQSFMPLKVVAFTSSIKNEVYVPFTLTWAAGSDYDIDKLYLMGYSIREDGTLYTNTHLGSEYNTAQRLKLPRGKGRTFSIGTDGIIVTKEDLNNFFHDKDLTKFEECLTNGSTTITFTGGSSKQQERFLKHLNRHEHYKMTPSQEDGALKNSVVERIINVLHNPKNMINMLKPVSSDSLKKVAEKSPIGKRELSLNLDTPSVIMLMQYQNMLGKTGIASSATGLKAYFGVMAYYAKGMRQIEALLFNAWRADSKVNKELMLRQILTVLDEYAFNSPLTNELRMISNVNPEMIFKILSFSDDPDFWKIPIGSYKNERNLNYGDAIKDGKIDIKKILTMLGENSNRSDCPSNDSEVLTASTDNAKDPILGKVNALPETIDIWTYLFSVGENIDDVSDFMSSKVMRTICSFLSTNIFGTNERFATFEKCLDFVADVSPIHIKNYMWTNLITFENTDSITRWDGTIPMKDSLLYMLLHDSSGNFRPGVEKMLLHIGINKPLINKSDIYRELFELIHRDYQNGMFFTKIMSTYYGEEYNPRKILLEYLRKQIVLDKSQGLSGDISIQDQEEIERLRIEAELAAAQAAIDNEEAGFYIEEEEQTPDNELLYKYIKNFYIPKCEMLMYVPEGPTEFNYSYFQKADNYWESEVASNLRKLQEIILPGVLEQQLVGKSLSNNKGLATTDYDEYNWIAQYEKRVNAIYSKKLPNAAIPFSFIKFIDDIEYRKDQLQQMQRCRTTYNTLDVFTSVEHFWKRAHAIGLLRHLTETIGVFKLERKLEREVLGKDKSKTVSKEHGYVLSNLGWTKLRHFTKEIIIQNWFMLQKGLTFRIPTNENYWSSSSATRTTVNAVVDKPFELDLSTYHGQKSFKLLMESYIIPKMKIDPEFESEEFIQRLMPTEITDYVTGEVTTYYKYPFPLRKGKSTSKYNAMYDEVLLSFNKLAQRELDPSYKIGNWKIGELFFIYNLIVHKDTASSDSFSELFTDLVIAGNPLKLVKNYYDFITSLDSNVDNIIYDINDLKIMLVGTSDEYHVFDKDKGESVRRRNGTIEVTTSSGTYEMGTRSEDDTFKIYYLTHNNYRTDKYRKELEKSKTFEKSRIRTYSPKLNDLETKRAIVDNLIKQFNYKSGISVMLLTTEQIKSRFKHISDSDINLYNQLVQERAFIHDGIVYINEDTMSIESPVHEFMHIVCAAMKFGPNPHKYYELLRKVASDKEIARAFADEISTISEDKRNLPDYREEVLVKVLAGYFGKRFNAEWQAKVGDKLSSIRAEEYVADIVKTIFGTTSVPSDYSQSLNEYLQEFKSELFDMSDCWRVNVVQSQRLKAIRKMLIKTDNLNYEGDC